MVIDNEFKEVSEYIKELKFVKSELIHTLSEAHANSIGKAAKYYPAKVNQLLTQRNIESVSGCFPFLDLAMIKQKKQHIDLIDLNTDKNDEDLIRDIIRRIDQELKEI